MRAEIAEAYLEETVKTSKKGAKTDTVKLKEKLKKIAVNEEDAIVLEHHPKEF